MTDTARLSASQRSKPKAMTIEQLRQAGRLLYGDQWQSALARTLDVDNRTVRRWASGESAIKQSIASEIIELLKNNQSEINQFIEKMESNKG